MKDPGDVGELVEETDEEQNNDDVIVQGSSKCSIGEEGIEHDEGGDEGENIEDEIGPEADGRCNGWRLIGSEVVCGDGVI